MQPGAIRAHFWPIRYKQKSTVWTFYGSYYFVDENGQIQLVHHFLKYFLREKEIGSSQQSWAESRELSEASCPYTWTASPPPTHGHAPTFQHSTLEGYICYSWWTHTDTSLSPKVYSSEFILGIVHPMDFDKYITTRIHHERFIHSGFTAIEIPCVPSILPFLTSVPGNHWHFYCLHSFVFSRMSYSWNHTVCSVFRLASFT